MALNELGWVPIIFSIWLFFVHHGLDIYDLPCTFATSRSRLQPTDAVELLQRQNKIPVSSKR